MTSYDSEDKTLSVQVRESGRGFSKLDMETLFKEPQIQYYGRSSLGDMEILGIDLATCKQILEYSEGKISVYSEGEGKGSTIMFTMKMYPVNQQTSSSNASQLLDFQQIENEMATAKDGKSNRDPSSSTTQRHLMENISQHSHHLQNMPFQEQEYHFVSSGGIVSD